MPQGKRLLSETRENLHKTDPAQSKTTFFFFFKEGFPGDSVLRIHLPMQETQTQVQSLIREDPTRHRATKPVGTIIEPEL